MTRLEALEAVAEAAREALTTLRNTRTNIMVAATYDTKWEGVADLMKPRIDVLADALTGLDALPAEPQPQGETVTLAVWRVGDHYEFTVPRLLRGNHCFLRGTVTLPLNRESGR